jgi:uncharacterized protein YyaL (SSP411 family)
MSEKKANRLIEEKSPYLLKHAHNPVDWYPWGEEAFRRARGEDKPIFLSVGYTTCHWCNVMEDESFSDPEVAVLMNEAFVSVKVDREERPDVDAIYMAVCQMLTGAGGWPLTVIMTPEEKPFFAGTYFPKHSRFGRIGMMEFIPRVRELWKDEREKVFSSAENITASLERVSENEPGGELGEEALHAAYRSLKGTFDPEHGGFGSSPKFPIPHNLRFLLRYWRRTGEGDALSMVEKTLRAMRLGGMYDQLGFGFHRYSTDREWLVPHFEKMLYDQALLSMAYAEAYQATKKEEYAEVVREVLSFVEKEMISPEGAFYSAWSADSEGEEGRFYLWRKEEVHDVLEDEQAEMLVKALNIESRGNYVDEMRGERTGDNILHLKRTLPEVAEELGAVEADIRSAMDSLYEQRKKREHPELDDKVLTDWNGLMIAALAMASGALGERHYLVLASRAADFILTGMRDREGRLLHRYRMGEAAVRACADDYAFLTWGLIELYEASFRAEYLEQALGLSEDFVRYFRDEGGGFFFTPSYGEDLLVRRMELYDAAVPSANSVSLLNFLRLGKLTGKGDFVNTGAGIIGAFARCVAEAPEAYTQFLAGANFALGPSHEVVVAGDPEAEDTREMLTALHTGFFPNKSVLLRPAGGREALILRLNPLLEGKESHGGRSTAYVCRDFACAEPTTDARKMEMMLGGRGDPTNREE